MKNEARQLFTHDNNKRQNDYGQNHYNFFQNAIVIANSGKQASKEHYLKAQSKKSLCEFFASLRLCVSFIILQQRVISAFAVKHRTDGAPFDHFILKKTIVLPCSGQTGDKTSVTNFMNVHFPNSCHSRHSLFGFRF